MSQECSYSPKEKRKQQTSAEELSKTEAILVKKHEKQQGELSPPPSFSSLSDVDPMVLLIDGASSNGNYSLAAGDCYCNSHDKDPEEQEEKSYGRTAITSTSQDSGIGSETGTSTDRRQLTFVDDRSRPNQTSSNFPVEEIHLNIESKQQLTQDRASIEHCPLQNIVNITSPGNTVMIGNHNTINHCLEPHSNTGIEQLKDLTAIPLGCDSIRLDWKPNDNEVIEKCQIHRSLSDCSVWSFIQEVPGGVQSYTDSGLNPATNYWYKVTAFDQKGMRTTSLPTQVQTKEVKIEEMARSILQKRYIKHLQSNTAKRMNSKYNIPDVQKVYIPITFTYKHSINLSECSDIVEDVTIPEVEFNLTDYKITCILAPSGSGKTVFCRRSAYRWAYGKRLTNIKLLFYLEGKYIDPKVSLFESVFLQLLQHPNIIERKKELESWVFNNQNQVMFIIDAGEQIFSSTSSDNQLHQCNLTSFLESFCCPDTHIVVATQTQMPCNNFDIIVNMNGYTDQNIDRYIDKYFNDKKQADSLKQKKRLNRNFHSLMHNPLNTFLICILWSRDPKCIRGNITESELFDLVLHKRIEWYCASYNLRISQATKVTQKLFRLAWEGIQVNTWVFDTEFVLKSYLNNSELNLAVNMGLLITLENNKDISFPHRKFQENFSSRYITEERNERLYAQCWKLSSLYEKRTETVCLFVTEILNKNENALKAFFSTFCSVYTEKETFVSTVNSVYHQNLLAILLKCLSVADLPNLTITDILHCVIEDHSFYINGQFHTMTFDSVRGLNCLLSSFAISDLKSLSIANLSSIEKQALVNLGEIVQKSFFLRELDVSVTGMDLDRECLGIDDNSGIESFQLSLSRSVHLHNIKIEAYLDKMSPKAASCVPLVLRSKFLTQLSLFCIYHSHCGHVVRGNLSYCKRYKSYVEFMESFARELKNNTSLLSLVLSDSIFLDHSLCEKVMTALCLHPTLESLTIDGQLNGSCKLRLSGIQLLANFFEKTKILKMFNLQIMTFISKDFDSNSKEGQREKKENRQKMATLSEGLIANKSIDSLNLRFGHLFPTDKKHIIKIVKEMKQLRYFVLTCRIVDVILLVDLADALRATRNLQSLSLGGAFDSQTGIGRIADAIGQIRSIREVTFWGNSFEANCLRCLVECVKRWETIPEPKKLTLHGEVCKYNRNEGGLTAEELKSNWATANQACEEVRQLTSVVDLVTRLEPKRGPSGAVVLVKEDADANDL